jgi:vacuolar-type H+-ATPase subunit B/Vma2
MEEMLNTAWQLVSDWFSPEETGIKSELVVRYWKGKP